MSAQIDEPILLCCDLDRTLIPNGAAPESPEARTRLAALCAHPQVHIAFVSGRDLGLVIDGMVEWSLPVPDFIIGDVGTTIYAPTGEGADAMGGWRHWPAWTAEIAPDWNGLTHDDVTELFADISALTQQEPGKQGAFKASYYVGLDANRDVLDAELHGRLWQHGVDARLIWSVDEAAKVALLDVLPARASKLHAIEFLIAHEGYDLKRTVFSGDSGNDMHALASHLQGVLVANAEASIKQEALKLVAAGDLADTLYVAQGGFMGMNGNYTAGVLEGIAHFIPETVDWMTANDADRSAGSGTD